MPQAIDKILLIAFACEPNYGSEPGVGWDLATSLARACRRVHIITHECHRVAIERHVATASATDESLQNLSFTYFKLNAPLSWLRKCQAGLNLYYYAWQVALRRVVRALHDRMEFDVVHHATYARYWMPSAAAAVARCEKPAVFVFGPVGGGEDMPAAFLEGLSLRGKVLESARTAARRVFEFDPFLRRTIRAADLSLAATHETAARMRAMGAQRVEVCSAIGWTPEPSPPVAMPEARVRFLAGGRMLYWKGFHLGIRAFAKANLANAELVFFGDGPARASLEAIVAELKLGDRIRFAGATPRDAFIAALNACDVFVHPSLHDSGGGVCIEAMAAAKPVICLKLGGPGAIVTDDSGIRVDAVTQAQTIDDLADAMKRLATDAALRQRLGAAGRQHIEQHYDWDRRAAAFVEMYRAAARGSLRAPAENIAEENIAGLELRNANS